VGVEHVMQRGAAVRRRAAPESSLGVLRRRLVRCV
jgi:hypothetical protein